MVLNMHSQDYAHLPPQVREDLVKFGHVYFVTNFGFDQFIYWLSFWHSYWPVFDIVIDSYWPVIDQFLRTQPHVLYDLPFTAPCCINIYEYNMLVMAQGSYHTTVRLAYFIVSTGSESVPIRSHQVVWWGPWSLKKLTEFGVGCSLYCEREDK